MKAETKVPFLSAIPLVGRAFKYESNNNKKMIRIFMLQPRLLENTNAEDFGSLIENPFQPIDKKTSQALKQLQAFMR